MYLYKHLSRSCAMEKSMICPSKLPQYTVVEFSFAGVLWAMGSGMAMTTLCFVLGFPNAFVHLICTIQCSQSGTTCKIIINQSFPILLIGCIQTFLIFVSVGFIGSSITCVFQFQKQKGVEEPVLYSSLVFISYIRTYSVYIPIIRFPVMSSSLNKNHISGIQKCCAILFPWIELTRIYRRSRGNFFIV